MWNDRVFKGGTVGCRFLEGSPDLHVLVEFHGTSVPLIQVRNVFFLKSRTDI